MKNLILNYNRGPSKHSEYGTPKRGSTTKTSITAVKPRQTVTVAMFTLGK